MRGMPHKLDHALDDDQITAAYHNALGILAAQGQPTQADIDKWRADMWGLAAKYANADPRFIRVDDGEGPDE